MGGQQSHPAGTSKNFGDKKLSFTTLLLYDDVENCKQGEIGYARGGGVERRKKKV